MSKKADTLALVSSRWAKELIHYHFWALDEQTSLYISIFDVSMSKRGDTFACLSSRWANKLIHSHFWALDGQKRWCIRTFELSMSKTADTLTLSKARGPEGPAEGPGPWAEIRGTFGLSSSIPLHQEVRTLKAKPNWGKKTHYHV